MEFKNFIYEMHWQDMHPKGFAEFRSKYLKFKNSLDLFVQFSNFKDSTMDKSIYNNPDHRDPTGNYAYPLKYVLNYPADIWYGKAAKYLRVLRSKAKNVLWINRMNSAEMNHVLHKMGINSDITYLKKLFKYKDVNGLAKAFLAAIQLDLDAPVKNPSDSSEYPVRSQIEQNRLFRKAGFDAIRDDSRTHSSAVINHREPEQIVFLTPTSFDVIDIFYLNIKDNNPSLTQVHEYEKNVKKLGAMIFQEMQDQVVSNKKLNSELFAFWSKAGRRLEIQIITPDDYYTDKKLGQKTHKEFKFHNKKPIKITLHSEKELVILNFEPEERFEEIARYVANYWRKKPEAKGWQPDSKKRYEDDLEAEHKKSQEEYLKKIMTQRDKEEEEFISVIEKVAEKLNINFKPNKSRKYNYTEIIDYIKNARRSKPIEKVWEEIESDFNKLLKSDPELYEDGTIMGIYFSPRNGPEDLRQLVQIINELDKKEKFDGRFSFSYFAYRD